MALRNRCAFAEGSPCVFLYTSGTQITQSNVGCALTVALSGTGYSNRVACLKLRKTAVTQVHNSYPDRKHDVDAHMCHRVATAEKHYRICEKQKNSVK